MRINLVSALALVLCSPAWGQLALDKAMGTAMNAATVNVTISPAASSYVVIGITPGWSGMPTGCSCTGAVCSAQPVATYSTGIPGYVYSIVNAPSGITGVSCTFSGTSQHSVIVASFMGTRSSGAEDGSTVQNNGSGTSMNTAAKTTSCSDTVLVAIYNVQDNPSVGNPSAGWTDIGGASGYSGGHHKVAGSYRIVSSTGSYSDSRSLSLTKEWRVTTIAVKGAACVAPPAALRRVIN